MALYQTQSQILVEHEEVTLSSIEVFQVRVFGMFQDQLPLCETSSTYIHSLSRKKYLVIIDRLIDNLNDRLMNR